MEMTTNSSKKRKKSQFREVTNVKKQHVMQGRKSENTHRATKLWIDLLKDFLTENKHPDISEVSNVDLPSILENFYVAVRSKRKVEIKQAEQSQNLEESEQENNNDDDEDCMYSNSTMKAIRAALNRFFKETRKIDISSDSNFIHANEIFQGLLKINKSKGRGTVVHKKPLSNEDLENLFNYFKESMSKPPNAQKLQEILLFYIIYFTGRRGRENLRVMKKNTFQVAQDSNGRRFIYQAIDESNKNHNEMDDDPSTQGRIYKMQGN